MKNTFINTLEKLGISKRKKVGDYSKGMQKMLSIVLSMSHREATYSR